MKTINIPPLQKRQFSVMYELLKDAEKFDNIGEKDVSIEILTTLRNFIEQYKSNLK